MGSIRGERGRTSTEGPLCRGSPRPSRRPSHRLPGGHSGGEPILLGQTLIVAGYQKPIVALRIIRKGGQWSTEDAWSNPGASLYMADGVVVGDTLFGLSQRNSGQYFLLDVKTGKTVWTGMPRQATNAAIVRAGNVVFALEDDGELVVGRVSAAAFQELRRYTVSDTATWAQPVISGNRILVKDAATLALWTLS